jgi:hypothetical protein
LKKQGAFAHAGLTADKGDRPRDQATTEHSIELVDTSGTWRSVRSIDLADALW